MTTRPYLVHDIETGTNHDESTADNTTATEGQAS